MNKFIGTGRWTKDLELKFLPGTGNAVANGTIAINRPFKNQEGKMEADFLNVKIWGKQAENAANYTQKGSLVAVEGRVQNRSYETQTGEKRYITEIVADRIEFLESKKNGQTNNFESVGLEPEGFQALDDDDIPF